MTTPLPAVPMALDQIEATLCTLVRDATPARQPGRGRPQVLPAMLLWVGLTLCVLRGFDSQRDLWRLLTGQGLWHWQRLEISDEAVYRRLASTDASPLAAVFAQLTAQLTERTAPWADHTLAPFAAEVVALDETRLDPVARSLPVLRQVAVGDHALLPGAIAGLYDLRRQLWRTLQPRYGPHQNEKVAAREVVADLPAGSLILADLGYFSFPWFDDLHEAGHYWISRLRGKTSYVIAHVYYQEHQTLDALVWLGKHRADRAKQLVRLVRYPHGNATRTFITTVTDPRLCSIRQIAELYARRWDIEMAVKTVKRHLGLHLLWSAKPAVIAQQVWAVLVIAQILHALRLEIAGRAGVPTLDVSLPLLIKYLPQYAAQGIDPIAAFGADGKRLGFIRPARRVAICAPEIAHHLLRWPPPDLVRTRPPRYRSRLTPQVPCPTN